MKLLEQRKTTLRAREIPYGACQPHKGNETPTGSNGQKAEGGKPKKGGNKRPIGRLIRARALAPIPAGGPQCTLADSDAKILGHWGSSRRVALRRSTRCADRIGFTFPRSHIQTLTHTHMYSFPFGKIEDQVGETKRIGNMKHALDSPPRDDGFNDLGFLACALWGRAHTTFGKAE